MRLLRWFAVHRMWFVPERAKPPITCVDQPHCDAVLAMLGFDEYRGMCLQYNGSYWGWHGYLMRDDLTVKDHLIGSPPWTEVSGKYSDAFLKYLDLPPVISKRMIRNGDYFD